jgi:hypothetical protein
VHGRIHTFDFARPARGFSCPQRTSNSYTFGNVMKQIKGGQAPQKPPKPIEQIAEPTPATTCTLLDLTNETCRFPVGKPSPVQWFCGSPGGDLAAGMPYCGWHAKRCFTQTTWRGVPVQA